MNNPTDDEYVVTIARHGSRTTSRSDVFLNYHLYGAPDGPIGMDYFVWMIRNAARTIVVDTGFSRAGGESRGREILTEVPTLFTELGVHPEQSPLVIITHAHYDHIGNLNFFPTSHFLIARKEYEFWRGPHATKPLFHHSVEERELGKLEELAQSGQLEFFEGSRVVAPGVEVIEVGGHTPGQSVVTVNTSEGVTLIASDAVHYYEELDRDMPFSSVADIVEMYDAFAHIRSRIEAGEITHVVAGHDPSTLDRFTRVDGPLAAEVATIGSLEPDGARK